MNITVFFEAYVEAALWSSTDDDGDSLDWYCCISDLSDEARKQMLDDCCAFLADNEELLERACDAHSYDDSMAGLDFWLTRNRHGAGFWDRGLGDIGDALTKNAHAYGSSELHLDDDGKVHLQ